MKRIRVALLVAALLLVGACSPSAGAETPSASLPEAPGWYSGPYNSDVAEMLAVYEAYFEAFTRHEAAGGAESLPDELANIMMEPGYSSCEESLHQMWSDGYLPSETYQAKTAWATQAAEDDLREGAEIGLSTCEEYAGGQWVDASGSLRGSEAQVSYQINYSFKVDSDDQLKLLWASFNEVTSCSK